MKSNSKDYLKYWRIVKHYIKLKHGLNQQDLEMLLFLKSEEYFSREKFKEYGRTMSWHPTRLKEMIDRGWVEIFRPYKNFKKAIYKLSPKAKHVLNSVYRKLEGEEPFTDNPDINPLRKKRLTYANRMYAKEMDVINEAILQRRRLAPE